MRDEVADLKREARTDIIIGIAEAAGAGGALAGGQVLPAIAGGYLASENFVEGCTRYNEAKELEKRVDDLEKFIQEEQGIEEDKSSKSWWQIWK
jgi:hypothetical protein